MNKYIEKRKSIRKYDQTPLDEATLEKVRAKIEAIRPLYPDIKYSIDLTTKTKGMFNIKAPHYLVFRSEKKEGAYENIGFIGQQLDLFFPENGLGACWLGVSKPEEDSDSGMPCFLCMSFGKPGEVLYRELSEFKRKSLNEISEGSDPRLDSARLAPSGMNRQNWYFVAENSKIHCYQKKLNPLVGIWFNSLARIDLGIAICHIAESSESFKFANESDAPERKGYIYLGTVTG